MTAVDMRLLAPLLYYQDADLELHQLSADTVLHYELKPGAAGNFHYTNSGLTRRVSINALGSRDKDRQAAKPEGTFRILCIGASNTYGMRVNDEETYPAFLERKLNAGGKRRYEVWNLGVPAYVPTQNIRQAQVALDRYAPDLILFQLSNIGRRPFLLGAPYKQFFEADAGLFAENLKWWPQSPSWLGRWRLGRILAIAINRWRMPAYEPGQPRPPGEDVDRPGEFSDFFAQVAGRVPIVFLIRPGPAGQVTDEIAELEKRGAAVIRLDESLPAGHSQEHLAIHPPAYVYQWYADAIAPRLQKL